MLKLKQLSERSKDQGLFTTRKNIGSKEILEKVATTDLYRFQDLWRMQPVLKWKIQIISLYKAKLMPYA